MAELSGKQTRYLRGRGHHLQPVVMVGREGLSGRLLASVEEALEAHELIKVKVQEGCLLDRHTVAGDLARATGAALVQVLGKTILLYRPGREPRIDFT
jgi:RNA-binding protein